jgi:anti-sigma factor RsiW
VHQEEHSYYRDRLSAYFDDELSTRETEAVKEHLSRCEECRNLLEQLKRLDRLVERHTQLAGDEYWEQSARRIEERLGATTDRQVTDIRSSRWRGFVSKVAVAAATVAILGYIALYEKEISSQMETAPSISAPAVPAAPTESMAVQVKPIPTDKAATEPPRQTAYMFKKTGSTTVSKEKVPEVQKSLSTDKLSVGKGETKISTFADRPDQPVVSSQATTPVVVHKEKSAIKRPSLSAELQPAQDLQEHIDSSGVGKESAVVREPADIALAPPVLPDAWRQPADLEQWRQRRDSLQTLYADLTSPHRVLSETKSRKKKPLPTVEQVEALLLYSHYQVARLTQDEAERAAAMEFLSAYASKSDSRFKTEAESYLQALGKQ